MDALNQLLNCMPSMWMKYSLSIIYMQALYIPSQKTVIHTIVIRPGSAQMTKAPRDT